MAKIISLVSNKGGVGKSTTAIHLATYFSEFGKTILIDGDLNRTSVNWSEDALSFLVIDENQLDAISDVDYLIIDTPARPESGDFQDLVDSSDLLILPTIPDILSLRPLLSMAEGLDDDVNYRVLLAVVPPHPSKEGATMLEELKDNDVPVFETLIRRSAGYPRSALEGKTIRDMKVSNFKRFWRDYKELGNEVMEILNNG